jgi:hypothetical protein
MRLRCVEMVWKIVDGVGGLGWGFGGVETLQCNVSTGINGINVPKTGLNDTKKQYPRYPKTVSKKHWCHVSYIHDVHQKIFTTSI